MLPPPRHPCHPAMVNTTMFFDIMDCEPFECISFELFPDEVPKTAENIHAQHWGKGFDYKSSCFHRIIQGLMYQGGGHKSTQVEKIWWWEFYPEAYGSWPLVHGIWWTQHKWFLVFLCIAKTKSLNASMWSLARCKREWILWKPWNALGLGMTRQEDHCWVWTNLTNLTCVLS